VLNVQCWREPRLLSLSLSLSLSNRARPAAQGIQKTIFRMPLEILSARRARARKTCRWNVTRRRLLRSRMTQVRGGSLVSTRGYLSGNPVPAILARSMLDTLIRRACTGYILPARRTREQSAASGSVARQNGPNIVGQRSPLSMRGLHDDCEASE